MTIVKEIYSSPSLKDDVKIASESAAEEAELELQMLLKQFEDWSKKNKGTFKDFMNDKGDSPVRSIKLNSGGPVTGNSLAEDYGDLIDAWVRKIDVLENESLTDYINRIRAAEKKND
jgi:hypothetical protein